MAASMTAQQTSASESPKKTCWKRLRSFFSLSHEGASPVDWKALIIIIVALFGGAYTITFLFPFLPDMVLHFGYAEEDKGFYAGYIASSMFVGRALGSYFWGWMADKYGRRPVLIGSSVAVAVSNLAFGFSSNLATACAFRFISGIINGIVVSCKAIIYDISDDTNQAVGMSTLAMAWGTGVVMGPLISGYLAEPAKKYPDLFPEGSLLHTFPFLLPSIMACIFPTIGVIVVFLKLPETLNRSIKKTTRENVDDPLLGAKEKSSQNGDCRGENARPPSETEQTLERSKSLSVLYVPSKKLGKSNKLNISLNHLNKSDQKSRTDLHKPSKSLGYLHSYGPPGDDGTIYGCISGALSVHTITSIREETPETTRKRIVMDSKNSTKNVPQDEAKESRNTNHTSESRIEIPSVTVSQPACSSRDVTSQKSCCFKLKNITICRLLSQRDSVIAIAEYSLFSFAIIAWEEVFIVWASTDVNLGGLGFSAAEIGGAIGGSSTALIFIQVFVFPKLVTRWGPIRVLQGSTVYLIFVTTATACLRFLHSNPLPLWIILLTMNGVQKMTSTACFLTVSILTNNSVQPQYAGSINGISLTFSALARAAGPTVGGSVFAWSLTGGSRIGVPFDVNLVFFLLGIVYLLINIISAFIPASLEKQKKPQVAS